MSYSTQSLVKDIVVQFLVSRGKRYGIIVHAYPTNGSDAEVELVGSMNGTTWNSIALVDPTDNFTNRSSLVGPSASGECNVFYKYLGVRRLDAGAGPCRVYIGVKD